ncbi:MAG: glycosyltransferase family 2 protein [Rhabdochlamydiaceae bacterium]
MLISVHVLTKNSASTIEQTLMSLASFSEVVVFDTGSTDETLKIASHFPNVKIHQALMTGFGPAHNAAASLGSNDWILSIDSDEVLSPALIEELQQLDSKDPKCVYAILRDNYFNGKRITFCAGWYPDWVVRLYNRTVTQFSNDIVHEKVITQGLKVIKLKNKLRHVPYRSMADFLEKMQIYSSFFAAQYQGKKQSSLTRALFHGCATFCKNYFFKWGILGGREGFILSLYNAQTTYYKYLKLAELNKKL